MGRCFTTSKAFIPVDFECISSDESFFKMYFRVCSVCFALKWIFQAAFGGIFGIAKLLFVSSPREVLRNVNRDDVS